MLAHQSLVLMVAFLVILVIFTMNIMIPSKGTPIEKLILLATMFAVVLPIMFIKIYSVQCMINGNCNTFTWIIASAAMLLALVYLGLFLKKMMDKKRDLDLSVHLPGDEAHS